MLGQESSRALWRRDPLAIACVLALLLGLLGLAVAAGPAQAAKKGKGKKKPPVSLTAAGAKGASGKPTLLKGSAKKWAKGQRVVLLAKPTGTKSWARAGAVKLKKNGRFFFKVRPPLGKTSYKAIAQRRGKKAPKAHSKPLRLLGLPGATSTLSVGAGGQVTVGGLLRLRSSARSSCRSAKAAAGRRPARSPPGRRAGSRSASPSPLRPATGFTRRSSP